MAWNILIFALLIRAAFGSRVAAFYLFLSPIFFPIHTIRFAQAETNFSFDEFYGDPESEENQYIIRKQR